ncbi:MAG TPA: transcription-repair coupling factor [Thermoanaerobaculia bacterium]|nr:transcription-repair coupling factor [Thermoanaerobaculia bacterium]
MSEPRAPIADEIRELLAGSEAAGRIRRALLEGRRLELTGASLEARALLLSALAAGRPERIAVLVPSDSVLRELTEAIRLFHPSPGMVVAYPNPSLTPYQEVDPSLAVIRDEIRALGAVVRGEVELLVVTAPSLLRPIPRPEEFESRVAEIREGDELDPRGLLESLLENGYVRTDLVGEIGEMALRGGIIDLFPPNTEEPVRIELFGDTVESIRRFEVESQRTRERIERAVVFPVTQFRRSPRALRALAQLFARELSEPRWKRDVAEKIERLQEQGSFPGMENYLPLVSETTSFAALLSKEGERPWSLFAIEPDEIGASIRKYESFLRSEYEAAAERGKAVFSPERMLVPADRVRELAGRIELALSELHVAGNGFEELRVHAPASVSWIERLGELPAELARGRSEGRRQVLLTSTKGGREKAERLLRELEVPFVDQGTRLGDDLVVARGNLARGFRFDEVGLDVLSEWDLFEPPAAAALPARRKRTAESFAADLRDLKAGDYIVHVDHGIGRFAGLDRIAFGENEREVMQLEYANGGRLLLPMESLHLIQKYSGGGEAPAKLDRLGGTSWARTKASVKKAMRDMADELLKLYATRHMVSGHAFSRDSPWQFEFEEAFEYEETEDQVAAIDDIKSDMESRKPMDRLLCGDVGYGKTEVAMRAAFKAVMDGKQVAFLAPTTILAYQHYKTLLRRFASFPVTIELLSRFRSPKEQKQIEAKIGTGEIDVLVGTHRLLSKNVKFKDLGLLVIDEEQRFGVAQKERLKQLKKSVDVLAMSATPIPRTLHMSLTGVRDISIIETPPKDRLAIQTAVIGFHDEFVREAIEFERARGGQVFFVHNRIESIYSMKEHLERLVPGLRVIVGHGQIEEKELERSMMAFIAREYDVLLSTTIIENGIDIPAANTILIDHAERFGLSQLYQLRGRVGRSDRLAFCYLLVPSQRSLASDARKRLAAIQEFSDLGAGFRIAARDLEIRGAGNMLGGEQSGQIAAVGFEMYTKLLEETVRELRGESVEPEVETQMSLALDIYIPRDWISDENIRMTLYKKIAAARDEARLDDLHAEMRDRFGTVPPAVESLFSFVRLRLLAIRLGVVSIVRDRSIVAIRFAAAARIDPDRLLRMLELRPDAKFSPGGVLTLPLRETSALGIVAEIHAALSAVAGADAGSPDDGGEARTDAGQPRADTRGYGS